MSWRIVAHLLVARLGPPLVGAILALLADGGLADHRGREAAQAALVELSELLSSSPALARLAAPPSD